MQARDLVKARAHPSLPEPNGADVAIAHSGLMARGVAAKYIG
jgi:hypothetical protein